MKLELSNSLSPLQIIDLHYGKRVSVEVKLQNPRSPSPSGSVLTPSEVYSRLSNLHTGGLSPSLKCGDKLPIYPTDQEIIESIQKRHFFYNVITDGFGLRMPRFFRDGKQWFENQIHCDKILQTPVDEICV